MRLLFNSAKWHCSSDLTVEMALLEHHAARRAELPGVLRPPASFAIMKRRSARYAR